MKLKILAIILIVLTISSISANASETISSGIKGSDQKTALSDSRWQQINEDGFGNRHNIGPRGITIFNDTLVIGTDNIIDYWTQALTGMPIKEFLKLGLKMKLWQTIQSDGCEIWSYNGTVLRQIVGNKEEAVMKAGFGNKNNIELAVLIPYKGYLYAGLHNQEGCQIWRTRDINQTWELVVKDGFGDKTNAAVWVAEIFNDYLYVGTMNLKNGFEVFRTNDGTNWEIVVGNTTNIKNGFGNKRNVYAWSMCVYNDYLYLGTAEGGELWKTKDGTTWKPVIAYNGWVGAKLHGADCPIGFNGVLTRNIGGIRKMIVYNDELYCGFCGLRRGLNICLPKIKLMHPFNYLGSFGPLNGLEIWKYNSSKDNWTRVVGGINKGNFSGGFGDIWNQYPWSMVVSGGYLYVGTLRDEPVDIIIYKEKNDALLSLLKVKISCPVGGGELWRFDGNEWQLINEKGFGDLNNMGMRALQVYKNCIIAATINCITGCEMWKYSLSGD
jgi:hypothetical protein